MSKKEEKKKEGCVCHLVSTFSNIITILIQYFEHFPITKTIRKDLMNAKVSECITAAYRFNSEEVIISK